MKTVLIIAAAGEIATGAALLFAPSWVSQMLLGTELTGVALILARVAGVALISLGVACWPGTPLLAILIYSVAITAFLIYVGLASSVELTSPPMITIASGE